MFDCQWVALSVVECRVAVYSKMSQNGFSNWCVILVLSLYTGFLKIQVIQTPNISTFSTRKHPLGSPSFLYPRGSFHSTGDGRQLGESTTVCVLDELIKAYPQRLRVVPYTVHRPHFPGRVLRCCQGLHACAQGGSSVTQGPLLPSQRYSSHTPKVK